jgi:predicted RNA binding protein YcfA (HicA-like mRNA interferase family)
MVSRGIFNWTFREIVDFLQENGFKYSHAKGSHHFYVKVNTDHPEFIACIPFHGSKAIAPYTFRSIIAQSGIPKNRWLKK